MSFSNSTPVPTFRATDQQHEVRIDGMSPQDLATLKACDPFAYFSIPAVRNANLLAKDFDDEAAISEDCNRSQAVKRQSRLSVEGHSSKIYEDIFGIGSSDGSVTSMKTEDEEDDLYSYLALIARTTPSQPTTVATFPGETTTQQVNTNDLSPQELEALKESDPFLYYSIPVVREFAVLNKMGSAADLELPSNMEVKRQKRISFECHADLLLKDMIEDMAGENSDGNEGGDDDGDLFLSFLASQVSRRQEGQE